MKPCDWDSREKFEILIGPLREKARELGYALAVHGTLKRDIDLIACPWTDAAVDPKNLAEQLRLVVEKVNGFAQPGAREVSEYFLDGCPGGKDHGRLCWTWYLDKKGSDDCHGSYIDLSVMPRIREMHLDLVRERALSYALRADMCRTEDALEAERKGAVADIEDERMAKEKALSELRATREQLRKAQEVIDRHVADQVEGLHCVDCVAEPDQVCDCPMLVPIFEAMRGFEELLKPRPKPDVLGDIFPADEGSPT